MLNRSCLGYDTPGYSSSPVHCKSKICEQQIKDLLQLSSNFKSPKGVKDGELDATKSLISCRENAIKSSIWCTQNETFCCETFSHVKSLYGWKSKISPSHKPKVHEDNDSEEDLLRHTGGLKGNMYVLKQSPIHPLPHGRGLLGQRR
ncbi:MAG: hypothetical protein MOIL_00641 [Candidatus Methanolliviera sp. GoM_oil]|nr:MAG: hypothetical protein MOIL_00641 [Candidatus Methanolliviera sp. GoM_oil]